MTWSLVGSVGTAVQGASGAAITPTYGQTPTAGNLLVLMVAGISTTSGDDALPAAPSGWLVAKQIAAAGNCDSSIFYKSAAGGDATPTVALLTGQLLAGQLAEFHWSVGGLQPTPDQSSSGVGTTGLTVTATNGTADAQAGDLVIVVGGVEYAAAAAHTITHVINNGATTNAIGNNNATSSREHYAFAWGITTGNSGGDSDTATVTTTAPVHSALVLSSFQAVPITVSVLDATATAESLGTIPDGPILYEPINTFESVTVSIAGGGATLSVNVSDATTTASTSVSLAVTGTPPNLTINVADATTTGETHTVNPPNSSPQVTVTDSTATSEFVVIAFDPPIIFTLEASVSDSTATGEILGEQLVSFVSVNDATTTASTVNSEQLVSFVSVTDSTTTTSTGNTELLTSFVNVTDSTTTGETVAAQEPVALQVTVADATSTGEIVTVGEQGVTPFQVNVTDSTTTNSTGNVEELDCFVNVSDATTTGEQLGFQELSFVSATDSTATHEAVTVSLQAAGGFSINVSDATATTEAVSCTLPGPLLVALSDSTQAAEAVGVQFPTTGFFPAPRLCDPTLGTLILYSSQAVIKAYASAATLLAYSSTATVKSYSSSSAVKAYSSSCAVSTYTSKATPVAYQSFATVIPYTSTATPKQCSP